MSDALGNVAAGLVPIADLDALADPASRIVIACERAKVWLLEALSGDQIEQIVELKSQAEAIRVYTVQKQLGHDAELSAAEIVRRAERCIGLCIRKGQEEGRIKQRGKVDPADCRITVESALVSDGSNSGELSRGAYKLTDGITDEHFEKAIAEAKAENNLKRANVVRKLNGEGGADRWLALATLAAEGHTSSQIAELLGVRQETVALQARRRGIVLQADLVMGKTHRIDPTRILTAIVSDIVAIVPSCEMVDVAAVDSATIQQCAEDLSSALRSLRKFARLLWEAID